MCECSNAIPNKLYYYHLLTWKGKIRNKCIPKPSHIDVEFVNSWILQIIILHGDVVPVARPNLPYTLMNIKIWCLHPWKENYLNKYSTHKDDQIIHIINKTLEGKEILIHINQEYNKWYMMTTKLLWYKKAASLQN